MNAKGNQAFQRTDKIIEDAFVELCKAKKFEKVTVKDIIERANISKNTFYQHFRDKYELADRVNRSYADRIQENVQSAFFDVEGNLFDYPKEERQERLRARIDRKAGVSQELLAHLKKVSADGRDISSFVKEAYYEKYMESAHCADLDAIDREIEARLYSAVKQTLFELGSRQDLTSTIMARSDMLTVYALLYAIGIKSAEDRQRITEYLLSERENAMKRNGSL